MWRIVNQGKNVFYKYYKRSETISSLVSLLFYLILYSFILIIES